MTLFKGCIDIHDGQVKQIVGGTLLSDKDSETAATVKTNFVSVKPAGYYGTLYKDNNVVGTHVIKLGSSEANNAAAREALAAWPGELQVGGGISDVNAKQWLEWGAGKVIVTSWLFPNDAFDETRLAKLSEMVGRDKLVLDLSCRSRNGSWFVAIKKWTVVTDMELNEALFVHMAQYCDEFLIHAADVEGLCNGIDEKLVSKLGKWFENEKLHGKKVVYAGGARSLSDLKRVDELSRGKVDLTFGSALDIFGGSLVKFSDCVDWNKSK